MSTTVALPAADPMGPGSNATEPAGRLRECPDCGLIQRLPALPRSAVAHCVRCDHVLRRRRDDPVGRPLSLACAGLLLIMIASQEPFLDLDVRGLVRATTLVSGPEELASRDLFLPLALIVLATTLLVPAIRLGLIITVLLSLRRPLVPRLVVAMFRWVEWLRPWSMVEVFMLGVLVSYTRLVNLAHVDVGPALYALGGLILVTAATDAALDPEAVWQRLDRRHHGDHPAGRPGGTPVGCDTCGLVNGGGEPDCARCGARLRRRKPDSIQRTWALLAAAAILYIPANALPVLTLVRLGRGQPSTILGGAAELVDAGMWPLALLVFFASVTVPVLKLVGLSGMLIATHLGTGWRLGDRTRLYRIVEFIGRWSMIDVFVISILTAVVQLGRLASVYPGPGVLAFCSVVILTMLAAASFDPRLMWDAANRPAPLPRSRA